MRQAGPWLEVTSRLTGGALFGVLAGMAQQLTLAGLHFAPEAPLASGATAGDLTVQLGAAAGALIGNEVGKKR